MANPNGRGLIILCPARPNMKHNTSAEKDLACMRAFFRLLYVCYLKKGTSGDQGRRSEKTRIKIK